MVVMDVPGQVRELRGVFVMEVGQSGLMVTVTLQEAVKLKPVNAIIQLPVTEDRTAEVQVHVL